MIWGREIGCPMSHRMVGPSQPRDPNGLAGEPLTIHRTDVGVDGAGQPGPIVGGHSRGRPWARDGDIGPENP